MAVFFLIIILCDALIDSGRSFLLKVRWTTYLSVTFVSDGNWTVHIENIARSALKQVNVLRKLKFILSKQALSNIYLTFIRPVLEYACEVWDGCYERDIEKLEKIQLEAARIATGLTNLLVRIHYILRLDGKL